jgi:hypothetical protein
MAKMVVRDHPASSSEVVQRSRQRENEMSTEPATMNWRNYVGRFSVEFEVANHEDVVQAKMGSLTPEQVRRQRISGVVDTGAARLVLDCTRQVLLPRDPHGLIAEID